MTFMIFGKIVEMNIPDPVAQTYRIHNHKWMRRSLPSGIQNKRLNERNKRNKRNRNVERDANAIKVAKGLNDSFSRRTKESNPSAMYPRINRKEYRACTHVRFVHTQKKMNEAHAAPSH